MKDEAWARRGSASTLIFRTPSGGWGGRLSKSATAISFDMYQRITDEDPYQVPMRIYPAIHYTMGGLWVTYHLMSTIPGLFVIGEANFSSTTARTGSARAR